MKELRIDFPDYPPEEQERDARRLRLKRHAYMIKVDGEWAHFIVGKNENIQFYPHLEMIEVYNKIKENFPDHKPFVLENEHLTNYLLDVKRQREKNQLKIRFKEFERD